MRDSLKIGLLTIGCVSVFLGYIGHGLTAENYQFLLSLRLPKALAIVLAAIAISASSLVFQTVTNNRILTPSILGFDSLYVMIQVLLIVIFGSTAAIVTQAGLNFSISAAVMIGLSLTLFHFYFKYKGNNIFTLLLIGIICGSLFSSLTNFLTMLMDPNEFTVIQNKLFASFNNIQSDLVYWSLVPLSLCFILLMTIIKQLDVLWLGTDTASSLGIDTHKLTLKVMVVVTIMVAISTTLVGPVLFFGLITVSLTRELFSHYQHTFLISASCLIAVFILMSGQWFIEKVLTFETTISVIINLVGGSYFLYLLLRNKVN